jgi:hypothetical protein
MHRLAAVAIAFAVSFLALAVAGAALANHTDPQERIRPADQARAQAMVLKKRDMPPGVLALPANTTDTGIHCRGLDESDLTLTGKARSPAFTSGLTAISSTAHVFESAADAKASWRRGTSAAGTRCLAQVLREGFTQQGIQFRSLRKVAFPRAAQATVAYRVEMTLESGGNEVPVFADVVVLLHSRAYVGLMFVSGLAPSSRSLEVRLGRITARRMATAMRA